MGKNLLVLTHNLGGGAQAFLQQRQQEEWQGRTVFCVCPEGRFSLEPAELRVFPFGKPEAATVLPFSRENLQILLRELQIGELFINSLVGYPMRVIWQWLLEVGVPYTVFLHDYHCVCPEWSLACLARHCSESSNHSYCQHELPWKGGMELAEWRQGFSVLLQRAVRIQSPSTYAARLVQQVYPQLEIEIKPHVIAWPLRRTFQPRFVHRQPLRLVFLGSFWRNKGSLEILALHAHILEQGLPLQLVVLGEIVWQDVGETARTLAWAGRYDRESVSNLLVDLETAVVLVPSRFPETYCYTASEALLSGYPVLSLDIGAQAVRIASHDCGWVLPADSESGGVDEMCAWADYIVTRKGREEILHKAARTSRFSNGME
ncbi:MAG: hypothetical protein E7200_10840 [Selenomonas ruminantium]|nr:hypothetical protein [Selenomonas ruminantium]